MNHEPSYYTSNDYEFILNRLKRRYAKRNWWLQLVAIILALFSFIMTVAVLVLFLIYNRRHEYLIVFFVISLLSAVGSSLINSINKSHAVEQDLENKLKIMRAMEQFKGTPIYNKYVEDCNSEYMKEIRELSPASLRLI